MLRILINYIRALKARTWSREQIEKHQKKRLQKIHAYAKSHSSFYAALNGFPVISKREMMENFSNFNTQGISKEEAIARAMVGEDIGNLTVGLSSGTSGNCGVFLLSQKEKEAWCGHALAKLLPMSLFKRQTVGLFLRANSALYQTVQSRRIAFTFFDLQRPFDELYRQWIEKKPMVVIAPPSVLRLLAERGGHRPLRLIACAERLDPLDERVIAEAFDQPVFQVYQCTEGFLGTSCAHGSIHINEDLIYMEKEWIDEKSGRFVPIITDLYRSVQPIIRYRLDDVLRIRKKPCPCGSSHLALEAVEGRCDDILYFLKQGKPVPIFPDFFRREIMLTDPQIIDYQLIQRSPRRMLLFVDRPSLRLKQNIQDYVKQCGCEVPDIEFLSEPLARDMHQKLRRIKREFHADY
ncbi:MAG: hypothetical protein K9M07_07435 [Simkaniaceae bacterium]|nr:hypothetical protein [Simkaniaceae bacterium]